MKIESHGYVHEARISLVLVPETPVEETLLKMLWKHGRLEVCYGPGYSITTGREVTQEAGGGMDDQRRADL